MRSIIEEIYHSNTTPASNSINGKPIVLDILWIKKFEDGHGGVAYKVGLGDGVKRIYGLISPNLHGVVRAGRLAKGNVVELREWVFRRAGRRGESQGSMGSMGSLGSFGSESASGEGGIA